MSRSGSGLAGTEGSTNSLRSVNAKLVKSENVMVTHFRSASTPEPDTGPDKLLPAESFTSSSPFVPVKLWMPGEDEECDDEDLR